MISRNLRDKPDTTVPTKGVVELSRTTSNDNDAPVRLSMLVSSKMSEMSSTGRDSKADMVVTDTEVGGFCLPR